MWILSFARNLFKKYRKNILDTATKTGLGAAKIVSKKVAHKKTEATGELIRNKIAKKWNQKPCSGNQNLCLIWF